MVFVNVNVSRNVDVYKYRHNVDTYQGGVTVCQFQYNDERLSLVNLVTVNLVRVLLSNRLCQCHCCMVTR